ncbi:MAG: hypothetical protein GEU80_05360 [Dehalococcoidia bacterium]|nr:hypothetical protein [Dehalococcoidia bacterium]
MVGGNIRERYVIGVDDTDTPEAGSTSELMRALAERVDAEGFGEALGVTRHELWPSPKVPATGKNACYALAIETDRSVLDVEDLAVDFVRERAERAADPGVAILSRHSDMPHALAFGRRAQQELLRLQDAEQYAAESNVLVRGLGAKRAGMVGALAAAGLRGGGKDGRFVWLRGLRDLGGRVTAGQIRAATPIERILNEDGEELDRDDQVETFDWIRPRVEEGEPVLRTARSKEERRLWLPVDRRPSS